MDRRLIIDYLKRWMALYIVSFYGVFSFILILQKDPVLYPMMSSITLFVYCFYFMAELTYRTTRNHRALPVQREAYIKTIWIEGVIAPVLLACMTFFVGYVLGLLFSHGISDFLDLLPKCLVAWLIFSSSFFLVLILHRRWVSSMAFSAVFAAVVGSYFVFYFYLLKCWNESTSIQIAMTAASIPLTYLSYRYAPILADLQRGVHRFSHSLPANRDYRKQNLSIGWWDRFQSNPFIATPVISFFLIALSGYLLKWEPSVYQQGGAVLSFSVVFISFMFMIVVAVFRWGSILGSIPVFACLPISRNRLLLLLVSLPGIILLPLALAPVLGFQISIKWYFFAYTTALFNNAIFIKWGSAVVAFKLTLICFLLSFGVEIGQRYPSLYAVIAQAHLDSALLAVLIALALAWTRRLIFHSNAPYRKKMIPELTWH